MDVGSMVESWTEDSDYQGQLVWSEEIPAREAIYDRLDPPLPGVLAERLSERGIRDLYRHQVRGIRRVREGRHTVLVSGTASGKSLTYQVPIAERVLADPKTATFLIYPTKALAQDQLRSLRELRIPGLVAATYDGDTEPQERRRVRRYANVVLTNPDMLHFGILPHHARWADFLLRLRFVVVDELHVLRGMFGSHVAHILRRLRRVAAHYGSHPTFVFASATIGNPGELASRLAGLPVETVKGDDSPAGERLLALWNPPLDDRREGRRRSSLAESTDLYVDLVGADLHTIVFSRSRKATELIHRWAGQRLDGERAGRIAPYRGGYLPQDRRRIEAALFSGELLGVTATEALELGIDVGGLDAAVINTYPGTISSLWQQAGRAGRRRRRSLAVLVGGEDALDQYFMSHPQEVLTRSPEPAVVNPDNPLVVAAHTGCAAYELPLVPADRDYLGEGMEEAANQLLQAGHLRLRGGRLFWAHRQAPAPEIDLRSSGGPVYTIVDAGAGQLLGTIEEVRAFSQTHRGAVYLHQGATYLVEELDLARHEVRVRPADLDFYTQPKIEKSLQVIAIDAKESLGRFGHHLGRVRVESHVVAFQRKEQGSSTVLSLELLDLPPVEFETQAFWFTVPEELYEEAGIARAAVPGTLHAAEHAGIAMLPLFAICDRWDIGGLSIAHHPQTGTGTIFIYDGYPGGAGIAPVAFRAGEEHLRATLEAIRTCPCETGCPSCVQSPKCGNFNDPLDKAGAAALLEAALR
ncbi:MAG: DEAD/DEAH box helicase [Acidimicrobiia bacterium]